MAIINVYSGVFPWTVQKQRYDYKKGYQYNVGVASMKSHRRNRSGRDSYTTGGFSVYTKDQYDKNPTRPEMVQMRVYNNTTSYVPVGDVQTFIGFDKMIPSDVPPEMAEQIEKAFSKPYGIGRYYVSEGAGHINELRYNPSQQIMQVSFGGKSPATVTFFRVPKELYSELASLASSKSMLRGVDGTMRHAVGVRFWDLVRIRGQRVGSRYPYTYADTGSGIVRQGSEPGKYSEMMERQMSPQAEQPVDAHLEATITNKEEPSIADKEAIEKEQVLKALAQQVKSGKYSVGQEKAIRTMRERVEEKFGGIKSPAYREFSNAVTQGWGAIDKVAQKYKLYGGSEE
jgi:uncharacterized membrane-anchored protein